MKRVCLLISVLVFSVKVNMAQFVAHRTLNIEREYLAFYQKPDNAFDLTSCLPLGYVKDGSVDYTNAIQDGLDKHKIVQMPDFPILTTGLKVSSNSEIYFSQRSRLLMKPTDNGTYRVLDLNGVKNVKLYNVNIRGDRQLHKGTKGEWGNGIEIRGAQNVEIYSPYITECWGDGIMIREASKSSKNKPTQLKTQNIVIKGGVLDFNRRNGVSITSVDGVLIDGLKVYNTMGTAPKAGIMIEPNNAQGYLKDIKIKNVYIKNCPLGIAVNLAKFSNSGKGNHIDLEVSRTEVRDAVIGFQLAGYPSSPKKKQVDGSMKVSDLVVYDTERDLVIRNTYNILPVLNVAGMKIYKNGLKVDGQQAILKNVVSKKMILLN